jgi:hypothetical protein
MFVNTESVLLLLSLSSTVSVIDCGPADVTPMTTRLSVDSANGAGNEPNVHAPVPIFSTAVPGLDVVVLIIDETPDEPWQLP